VANPNQPRTTFDEEALGQLADSIKQYGILQPLVVTPHGQGKYAIVAGERRWRASQLAGLDKVSAIVRTTKELERLEIALVENVQRVDLSPLEQGASIEYLHQQFSMQYDAIAKRLGKAPSTLNNMVRLLKLPEDAKDALRSGEVNEGHCRAILALASAPEKQAELLNSIKRYGWTVRQAEQFVTSYKEGYKETNKAHVRMQTETDDTKKLSSYLGGVPVQIRRLAKGGRLMIAFKSDKDLERILKHLSK
jgi:ParB family chromosome partitioning protein